MTSILGKLQILGWVYLFQEAVDSSSSRSSRKYYILSSLDSMKGDNRGSRDGSSRSGLINNDICEKGGLVLYEGENHCRLNTERGE